MSIVFKDKLDLGGPTTLGDSKSNSGIPGFPDLADSTGGITPDAIKVNNQANYLVEKLMGKFSQNQESNFVGSGRQPHIGSVEGKLPLIDDPSERQTYSQTPILSVVIKKRVFSSLKSLYNPIYMDEGEKLLFRATKRLIQRKCSIMAQYERLTKISNMMDMGYSPAVILANLMASASTEDLSSKKATSYANKEDMSYANKANNASQVEENNSKKEETEDSYRRLEQIIRANEPQKETTYFIDPFDPENKDFGLGSGVFEITTISSMSTSLNLNGDGDCSFNLEDPYRILFINDEDIEISIQEEVRSKYSGPVNNALKELNYAQEYDRILNELRTDGGQKTISFTLYTAGENVSVQMSCAGVLLVNLPESEQLNTTEQKVTCNKVYSSLLRYGNEVNKANKGYNNDQDKDVEYARKRMRLFYLGKSLIQPMDSVHIFINGGTRKIDKNSFKDSSGNPLSSYDISQETYKTGIDDSLFKQEYELYVKNKNSKMTYDVYKKVRLLQVGQDSGMHVFGGLVKSVKDAFSASEGKFTLSVSVASNMEWLRISRYNSQPSLDQSQSFVMDPLTPFDITVDEATGLPADWKLSSENLKRLNECPKTYITTGKNVGKLVKNLEDLKSDIKMVDGSLITVFEHVPSLAYKWKEGIMTMKYNHFAKAPKSSSLMDSKQLVRDIGYFWSNTAFDNMDSANIISIIVSGFPYNPATFVQCAKASFISDYSLNTSRDFFHTFFDVHRSMIKVNGDFIPYKKIDVSREELAFSVNMQMQLTGKSSELSQLRNQFAKITDKINGLGGANPENVSVSSALQEQSKQLNKRIGDLVNDFDKQVANAKQLGKGGTVIQLAGDDISYDLAQTKNLKTFNEKLQYLTLRRKEDVAFNLDKNYLIISDEYDKDYDIQAFILQMRQESPELFKNTWLSVDDLCKNVARIIDFEFFADTQGHIVFRPPQYNKTPKTVFSEMIRIYTQQKVQVFPDFLKKLYVGRADSIMRDIFAIEWEIVMKGALLGFGVSGGDPDYSCDISNDWGFYLFIECGSYYTTTSNVGGIIQSYIQSSEAMDAETKKFIQGLVEDSNYYTQLNNTGGLFSPSAQYNLFNSIKTSSVSLGNKETYELARSKITQFSGIPSSEFAEYDKVKVGAISNGNSTPSVDTSNIISQISTLVSNRARLVKTLGKVIEQQDQVGNTALENLLENSEINNRLMIDDTKDYLGYMSGSRFVIKDEHILNYDFSEAPPEFTSVMVKGGDAIIGIGDENNPTGTNYVAFGCDFDMWRQYGWRTDKTFEKPYFTSAEIQCAPYAVMLLSRQRKNVVTGSVTVIGNEYYQLGDVVYLNERRLLYYVSGISHSFDYGTGFKTTLTLNYGHPPGEYIPTPLDIIGKMATLQGRMQNLYRVNRTLPNTNKLLSIVQFNSGDSNNDMFAGNVGMKNYRELVKAATAAKTELVDSKTSTAKIVLMSYTGDKANQSTRKQIITQWFNNPIQPIEINGIGRDGQGNGTTPLIVGTGDVKDYIIDSSCFLESHVSLCLADNVELSPTEQKMIRNFRITASEEAISLDKTLENVIEIRLVYAPDGGWNYNDSGVSQIKITPSVT